MKANRRWRMGDLEPGEPKARKGKKARKAKPTRPIGQVLAQPEQAALSDLLTALGVQHWDFVVVGDGSGSNWNQEVGWASVSIERATMERLVWVGAANRGTVNFAEIMAYLHPLTYFSAREVDRRKRGESRARAYNVHIITDSQYCRDTGRTRSAMVSKNVGLWACLNSLARTGLVLHWHWMRRQTTGLGRYCDQLSRLARLWIAEHDPQARLEAAGHRVYDITPGADG